ncbi:alpha-1,6-glucosidase domain-containing protein [Ideonella sp.]|uniref:alpha-1,6-glucosidase domain-containing protein n=1 Tax=Ideonella sp. TaxID=1929293 RepID=UPI0035B45F68
MSAAALAGPVAAAVPAACDAPGHTTLLSPAPAGEPAHAEAVWLDDRRLHWPGAPTAEAGSAAPAAFWLLHDPEAREAPRPGQPLPPTASAWRLDAAGSQGEGRAPAAAPGERWRHLAPGMTLALPAAAAAGVAGRLPGAWWLVRTSPDGVSSGAPRVQAATAPQHAALLDALFPAAADPAVLPQLGAVTRRGQPTGFHLWAPTARAVGVCVHAAPEGPATAWLPLQRDPRTGAWQARAPADWRGRTYTYLVEVYVPGTGWVRNRVTDPYAVSLTADSARAALLDLDDAALKPPGWDGHRAPALAAPTDAVIYELHVRDFSLHDPDVPAAHRGRYLAFTHAGSRGMRHLRDLARAGLTDVHLLPVFDLASVPERGCVTPRLPAAAPDSPAPQAALRAVAATDCFNWGYDPWHYNAPEGSYATDAVDPAVRVRELRAAVMALHRAGLRVGMDVVYNHTSASGQSLPSVLDRIVPGYYHRLDAQGRVERSTCCDNTATEHAMMARLMIDSVALWARAYRIDAFRFDLMGHQPREAMQRLQAVVDAAAGRPVHLIGEGWNFGEVADGRRFVQASQLSLNGTGIGTFSDRARDAVRGGSAGDSGIALTQRRGWVHGGVAADHARAQEARTQADLVRAGLAGTLRGYRLTPADGRTRPLAALDYAGQPAGYASEPAEVVNYVENHDNQTLFDNHLLKLPRGLDGHERARVQLLSLASVAFSQGVAYFHAGGELLRSKSLDRNSFDSGDWFNRIDWSGRRSAFGSGLPPAGDNEASWPVFQPLLADAARLAPTPADMAFTRAGFLDLLAMRASTTLFRLRTADEVMQRLSFPGSGPGANPWLIAARLDGRGLPGARFGAVMVLLNAADTPQSITLPDEAGAAWRLHPVQARRGAADRRVATQARMHRATGRFDVPARSAVVFVR